MAALWSCFRGGFYDDNSAFNSRAPVLYFPRTGLIYGAPLAEKITLFQSSLLVIL